MKWTLVFFIYGIFFTSAQNEFAFRNYTLESGLPSNTVYETFQDDKGYIYVGHNNGCSVFNGLSFLTPNLEGKSSALSNFISFSNGQLMCRNFQGKKFIYKDGKLKLFESSLKESWGFPTFLQDGDKHFIFQSGSFYTLDETGKGVPIKFNRKISRIYHGIVKDNKAYLFVSNDKNGSLICYDLDLKKVISSKDFDSGSNVALYKYSNGIVWIDNVTGASGVYEDGFIEKINVFNSMLPKDSKITGFCELKNGDKLISTFNGVYRVDDKWQLKTHYLEGIQCTHLMLDRDNALWVSSLQNGIFYVPNTDVIQLNAASLPGRNVKFSKIYTDKQFMYVGTYDGRIIKFNAKGELVKTYNFNRPVEVQSIQVSGDQLFTYCGGLLVVNEKSGVIQREIAISALKSIYAHDEELICGSSKGLYLIKDQNVRVFIDTLWIRNALPISDNIYLLESTENLYVFNSKLESLTLMQVRGTDICRIENQLFFRTEKSVYSIDSKLRKKMVYSSRVKIGQLYVTDGKLTLDLEDNQSFFLFGKEYKNKQNLSACVLRDVTYTGELGDYRVKGNSSIIQLIPKSIHFTPTLPRIELVKEMGDFTFYQQQYILPYIDNELTFQFDVLPNFYFVGEGSLYYRIVELNGGWKEALKKENYTVELLRIPPGDYTLEIYAKGGGAKSEIQRLSIKVKQPYYFQWWFVLLFFGFIVGCTYAVFRWRARLVEIKNERILKEQRLKMKALNSELVAIRSQMNPHFIFNSLSSIQTKILNEDRVEAYKNVSTFATLLRQALQFTSKEFLSLHEELDFSRNYISLEQTRTENSFDYLEEIDQEIDLNATTIPALILQPFIENAIRHGLMHSKNNKVLRLKITKKMDGFEAIIEDNGIGRRASSEINEEQRPDHVSFATKALQDRIDILREAGKMRVELRIEDLSPGTRVMINFKSR